MRQQGSNQRRPRGRSNRKPQLSPRSQTFDSNGPDVRVRGNAHQVYEKYLNLARDATSAGDRIAAESYFQFAEHYFRLLNDTTDPQRGVDFQRGGQRDRFGQQPYRDRDGQPYYGEPQGDGDGDGPFRPQGEQHGQDERGQGERGGEGGPREGLREGPREAPRANGQGHGPVPAASRHQDPAGDLESDFHRADQGNDPSGEQPEVPLARPEEPEAQAEAESAAPPKRRPGRPRRRPANGAEASPEGAGEESQSDKSDSEPASA